MSHRLPVILRGIVLERRETHLTHTKAIDRPRSLLFMTFFTYFSGQEMLQEAGLFSFGIVFGWLSCGFHWRNINQSGLCRWGTIPLGRNGAQKAVGETSRKSKERRLSVRLQRAVPVRKEGSVLGRYRI